MAALGLGLLAGPNSVGARGDNRTLSIYNVNTKEKLTVTFKKNGAYDRDALRQINHIMRDWRRNESTNMDPDLIDLIWELHTDLGSSKPVYLISGYRSPRTNEALRRSGGGQAKASRHTVGKAADIHFPDVGARDLRNSALVREVGGVGYYPGSRIPFIHVDTDRVRSWPRLPRDELAMLFPDRPTKHLPADGRPLTAQDRRVAMAKLQARGQAPIMVARAQPGPRQQAPVQIAEATPAAPVPVPRPERAPAPVAMPVQVAAAPAVVAEAEPATPAPETRPRPVLASLTAPPMSAAAGGRASLGLGWLAALDEMAGPAPAATPAGSGWSMASLGALPARAAEPVQPALHRAAAAPAPDIDTEHPEELSYQPYPVLPLLADAGAHLSGDLTGLAYPVVEDVGLRLLEPLTARPTRFVRDREPFPHEKRFIGATTAKLAEATSASRPRQSPWTAIR